MASEIGFAHLQVVQMGFFLFGRFVGPLLAWLWRFFYRWDVILFSRCSGYRFLFL